MIYILTIFFIDIFQKPSKLVRVTFYFNIFHLYKVRTMKFKVRGSIFQLYI